MEKGELIVSPYSHQLKKGDDKGRLDLT
jgi:hypothetical protein